MIYEKVTSDLGIESILRTDEDGKVWAIPADPANSDYQAYLATLAANSAPTAQ
jgi:hypothetical protein